eukprot:SAG31_NODE_97_length_25714_cov_19.477142_19_plen_61_part_00
MKFRIYQPGLCDVKGVRGSKKKVAELKALHEKEFMEAQLAEELALVERAEDDAKVSTNQT